MSIPGFSSTAPLIVAEGLTRYYGSFAAVKDVSFSIQEGEIVGLLGHNGAGKTTIMKMLTGFLEPSEGRARINGHDVETDRLAAQASIGYLSENCPLYPEMTVADFLDYAAELRGIPQAQRGGAIREAVAATELFEKTSSPIANLSRGYRQRVGVAQAILHKPKIVILDEPTNGLDPTQIKQMRTLVKRLAERATVMLSTHILQEVAAVCGRVIIVDHGRVAVDSTLEALRGGSRLRLLTDGTPERVTPLLASLNLAERIEPEAGTDGQAYTIHLNGHAARDVAPEIARAITNGGLRLFALYPDQRDLETVFADMTADAAREDVTHA